MHPRSFRLAALALAVALTGGCGGSGPKPVKVEGVVLLDGKPLPGATVRFVPLDRKGETAVGFARDDGTFRLTSQSGGEGALPGEYKVVVTPGAGQTLEAPTDPAAAQKMADLMMRKKAISKGITAPRPKRSPIPAEYTDENKTILKVTVPPPDGKVTLNLQGRAL
jgi:hypothetical protein